MKRNFITIMFIVCMIFVLFSFNDVKAASTTLTESKTVDAGTSVTINASVTAGAWDLTLSGGGQSYRIFGNTSVADNATASGSITFVANETTTVTLSGTIKDFYASDESKPEVVNKTTTITVKAQEPKPEPPETTPEPEPTTPDTPPAVTEKSSNANIKMIETSPVDFSGFKKDKFSGYEVNVENDVDKIYVNVTKEDSKASISLLNKTNSDTGKSWVYIKEGSNEIDVTITAEDGTTKKTYTISVIRAEKEEEEEPEEKPEEPEEDPMEEVFGLSEIKIEGVELKPEFKTDVYEYKVKVEDLDKLKITTLATEANSNIEILGNDNLKEGENVITIVVKSKDEEKNATYQITVIKSVKAVVDTENVTNEVAGVTEEPAIEKDNTNKMMIIIIAVLVVIAIIIIAIVINSRKNRSFYEIDEDDEEEQYEDNSFDNLYDDNKEKINATNANDQFFEEVKKSKGKRFK